MKQEDTGAYLVIWTSASSGRAKDGPLLDGYVGYRFGPEPEDSKQEAFSRASNMYKKLLDDSTTYAVHLSESVLSTDY